MSPEERATSLCDEVLDLHDARRLVVENAIRAAADLARAEERAANVAVCRKVAKEAARRAPTPEWAAEEAGRRIEARGRA